MAISRTIGSTKKPVKQSITKKAGSSTTSRSKIASGRNSTSRTLGRPSTKAPIKAKKR